MLLSAVLLLVLVGCNSEPEIITTKNGFRFKLIEAGKGEMAAPGSIMLLDMISKDDNDSIWVNSYDEGVPRPKKKVDSLWRLTEGGIEEVLFYLKKGDSVEFKMSAANVYAHGGMPITAKDHDFLTINLRVADVLTLKEYREWQIGAKKLFEATQLKKDIAAIQNYLNDDAIKAEMLDNGLHYVIHEKGKGNKAIIGQRVTINYSGYTLLGEYFDTNILEVALEKGVYDERKEPYKPTSIVLGEDPVIQGWVESLQLFNKGTKATIFIPSGLAYGRRAMNKVVNSNTVLIYDLEIIDIIDLESDAPN